MYLPDPFFLILVSLFGLTTHLTFAFQGHFGVPSLAREKAFCQYNERCFKNKFDSLRMILDDDDNDDDFLDLAFSSKRKKKKDFDIPHDIGVGTLSWGDPKRGFSTSPAQPRPMEFNKGYLSRVYKTLVEGGITFFDTAEVYGYKSMKEGQSSEQLLGQFMEKNMQYEAQIATKYMPIAWTNALVGGGVRGGRRAIVAALKASLTRLGSQEVDLYQLHFPFPYVGGNKALYEGFARCKDQGLCRHIGVSNHNKKQVEKAFFELRSLGVPLVSNQIELSLLNRKKLYDGTIDYCLQQGIKPIAHTPLARGLASGKCTVYNPTGGVYQGPRDQATAKYKLSDLKPYQELHETLERVAKSAKLRLSREVSPAQVSINWVKAKGAVPIPGVKSKKEAEELLGCIGWSLEENEIEELDQVSRKVAKK